MNHKLCSTKVEVILCTIPSNIKASKPSLLVEIVKLTESQKWTDSIITPLRSCFSGRNYISNIRCSLFCVWHPLPLYTPLQTKPEHTGRTVAESAKQSCSILCRHLDKTLFWIVVVCEHPRYICTCCLPIQGDGKLRGILLIALSGTVPWNMDKSIKNIIRSENCHICLC